MSALPRRLWPWERLKAHKLYPDMAMPREVPFGTGSSVYTLPEVPTIGFVRGRTSSSIGIRNISGETGRNLKISYTRIQLRFVFRDANDLDEPW